jgi:hypothetical protein
MFMKKIFFLLFLLLFTCSAYSQQLQNTILGCKYGSSREDVIFVINKQGFEYIDHGTKIELKSPIWGGISFDYGYFFFHLNKMYMCQFSVDFYSEKSALSTYTYLKNKLTNKYGYVKDTYHDGAKMTLYDDNINTIRLDQVEFDFNNKSFYGVNTVYCNWSILKEVTNEI